MRVLCVGMMVCDVLISPVPADIMKKDSIKIDKPIISCGGDALNVAISLSKLGLDVSIAGRIGNDSNGNYILAECEKNHIDHTNVIRDEAYSTATSFALIDTNGERHFLSENSIFSQTVSEDIHPQLIKSSNFIYFGSAMAMQGMNDGGIARLFQSAHAHGKTTVMDAAIDEKNKNSNWLEWLSPAFSETDIFFPSLDEAKLISRREEPEKIAEAFSQFGMKIFGIKLGGQGCYVTDFKEEKYLPGIKNLPVRDTTGAGDSFMAGLICALLHQHDAFESAAFANAVAALNIGAIGGTAGVPDYETALHFYKHIQEKQEQGEKN